MAQNVKISELQQNTNPTWKEEFPYAKSGSNGKMTLDTIKKFVWNGGWGWGSGTRTDEIFAPWTLPDSMESNTWIFTSDWLHGCEFDWNKAKVYEMATAFDVDWENTLLTTVTAPWDIYMWQLNDEWTRLILLWHLSTWRIMFWVESDNYGWTPFMFTDEATEYTYDEWEGGQQAAYFKSTADLTSETYDWLYVEWYNEGTWETEQHYANEFKFMWFNYWDWSNWYLYHPETWQYISAIVWYYEWNNPDFQLAYWPVEAHNITAILCIWDGREYPVYAYWDPFETWTNHWYATMDWHTEYFWWDANYTYDNNNQDTWNSWIIWDGDASIGTINDIVKFLWWKKYYLSSERYLWYDATKQIVTQYNVKWYGNDWDDDKINVPSFYRFQNDINNLNYGKQNNLWFTPENVALKISESWQKPRSTLYNLTRGRNAFSISFYSNWTKALLAWNSEFTIVDVATAYEITQQEIDNAVWEGYDSMAFSDTMWCIMLSETWDFLIARDWNIGVIYEYELSTPRDPSSITYTAEYNEVRNAIFENSWTYVWRREWDENDQAWYWNKYSCANPYEYDPATLTFVEHQWSWNPYPQRGGINNNANELMFSLDWTQLLYNYCTYSGWARVFNLSTPFDLSSVDADNYQQLPDGGWKWQPCEDFIFGWLYKYWYSPKASYPSMNTVIDWVALAYTPVEWTIDSGTVTISWTQFFTELTDLDSNITIDFTDVIPWMKYIIHWNSTQQVDITIWNMVYEPNRSQYWWTFQLDWEMYIELTAIADNKLFDLVWPQAMPVNP